MWLLTLYVYQTLLNLDQMIRYIQTNRTLRNYVNVRLYARRSTEHHSMKQKFKL